VRTSDEYKAFIERVDIERSLTTLTDRYGDCCVNDFKPVQLRDLRDHWREAGHVRKTINKAMGRSVDSSSGASERSSLSPTHTPGCSPNRT
jgi:hypothetical protein